MKTAARSITRIVEDQVNRWRILGAENPPRTAFLPLVTISRQPGSGGNIVAEQVAEMLGYDLFHQKVIHQMAQSTKVSTRLLETLDEKGLSILEDWIASLVDEQHLWPDQYLQHLMKVIGTIGNHGAAVIVGRGANFILPPERRFSVRIVAPLPTRIGHVARTFGVTAKEARRRIMRTESDRKAFIRKYFYADIGDPLNYDLVLNTGSLNTDQAARAICGLVRSRTSQATTQSQRPRAQSA